MQGFRNVVVNSLVRGLQFALKPYGPKDLHQGGSNTNENGPPQTRSFWLLWLDVHTGILVINSPPNEVNTNVKVTLTRTAMSRQQPFGYCPSLSVPIIYRFLLDGIELL